MVAEGGLAETDEENPIEFSAGLTAAIFGLLAIAHTYLGERRVIQQLLSADWRIEGLPRPAADRLLRAVWHAPTVAWLALAGVMLGWSPYLMVAFAAAITGVMIFVAIPAHGAWPLFTVAAVAAWWMDGSLTAGVLRMVGIVTAAVLVAAGLVHVYWAFGGRWMTDRVYPPSRKGSPTTMPGRWLTLAVAVLLGGFAGLVAIATTETAPSIVRWLVAAGAVVLAIRAVGDGKVAGFTKSDRSTAFAIADDRYFTPLIVLLAMGSFGAVLVGA